MISDISKGTGTKLIQKRHYTCHSDDCERRDNHPLNSNRL
jgi:hypothetical protein